MKSWKAQLKTPSWADILVAAKNTQGEIFHRTIILWIGKCSSFLLASDWFITNEIELGIGVD